MASQSVTRSLFSKPPKALTSLLYRSFSPISTITTTPASRSSLSLLHHFRPLSSLSILGFSNSRSYATRSTISSLNDPSPNFSSNRPPKETILLEGCDFEHWLVVVEKPENDPTRDEIIDGYIKTLTQVVGSEEEARMKIYSVSTRCYFAFGALVSEEVSYKLKELPNVRWVLPDSYLDVRNKDYGGEPFIDGRAVPYDPKYHEEWIRNNARANERNRRNDRPRTFDRSRNFDRRRENMQNRDYQQNSSTQSNQSNQAIQNASSSPMAADQGMQNSPSSMGGVPNRPMSTPPQPQNMSGVPSHPNFGGLPQPGNMSRGPSQPNMDGMHQNSYQPQPPNNYRPQPPNNYGPQPPNNYRPQPQNNYGPQPQNNYGVQPPNNGMGAGVPPANGGIGAMAPPNNSGMGAMQQPNNGYNGMAPRSNNNGGAMPPNAGWSGNGAGSQQNYQYGPNNGGSMPYQGSAENTGYQQNYTPTRD